MNASANCSNRSLYTSGAGSGVMRTQGFGLAGRAWRSSRATESEEATGAARAPNGARRAAVRKVVKCIVVVSMEGGRRTAEERELWIGRQIYKSCHEIPYVVAIPSPVPRHQKPPSPPHAHTQQRLDPIWDITTLAPIRVQARSLHSSLLVAIYRRRGDLGKRDDWGSPTKWTLVKGSRIYARAGTSFMCYLCEWAKLGKYLLPANQVAGNLPVAGKM